jgi:GNAT superfamily N-acetyltransferase
VDVSDLTERRLEATDADHLLALTEEARWNQTIADWRFMLANGSGWGLWTASGMPVASTLIVPYPPRFAWISMVLVSAPWRRLGLATRLTRLCLEDLQRLSLAPMLDASEAGRGVYEKLGFKALWTFDRMVAETPKRPAPTLPVRPLALTDLASVANFDAKTFGARRDAMLAYCCDDQAPYATILEDRGGFALGRDGQRTLHIGPVMARDAASAASLVAASLAGTSGPVSIDVPTKHADFRAALADMGFSPQRPFVRMTTAAEDFGDPSHCYAVAGPEFG